jgi:subtilase family serine protease
LDRTPGEHVVRVEADPDRRVAEPVETNNAREVRLGARP